MKKPEFIFANNAYVCGRIVKTITYKEQFIVIISSGNTKNPKVNKDGKIMRQLIKVVFFDQDAAYYSTRFKTGDFVKAYGVIQNVINPSKRISKIEIWGQGMSKERYNPKTHMDHNSIYLKGKVQTANKISDDYIIVNVLTKVDKVRQNRNPDSEIKEFTAQYKSITPIGIRCQKDAAEQLKKYTLGTWVEVNGRIFNKKRSIVTKTEDETENTTKNYIENRMIATSVKIVGEIQ